MYDDKDCPTQEQLTGHKYDGIEEYDNPTPGWWVFLFVASCFYAVFYFVYYHCSLEDRSIHEHYEQALAENLQLQFADIGELSQDVPTLLRLMQDPDLLTVGKSTFKANCVSCHGADGAGLVGPNLTDEQWKNVKSLHDIIHVVNDGAGNGAMPGWKTRLHPNEVVLVSAYVASLRGNNLPGPRPPEGDMIPPWSE